MTKAMSEQTADILFGGASARPEYVDDWDLDRLVARIADAIAAAPHGSFVDFAFRSVQNYPSVPATPDLDFTMPMPNWEEA